MLQHTANQLTKQPDIQTLLAQAGACMQELGYTDHGMRHALWVSEQAGSLLDRMGAAPGRGELARIAGLVHDVGNLFHRSHHGATGAVFVYPLLTDWGLTHKEASEVAAAIGHHESGSGHPVNDIGAALILADKGDVHASRVQDPPPLCPDLHDRVNLAVSSSEILVDRGDRTVSHSFRMDETSSPAQYMQIYGDRIPLLEQSARFLGYSFRLVINGREIKQKLPETPSGSK